MIIFEKDKIIYKDEAGCGSIISMTNHLIECLDRGANSIGLSKQAKQIIREALYDFAEKLKACAIKDGFAKEEK